MSDSRWDVVLYGATGFTGRQAARYFAAHAPEGLHWAVAGRDRERLERLRQETKAPGLEVADSRDPASVEAMVSRARVVLTTAGPFSRYGDPVVEACVRQRVDYVDISGETPWVRSLIDRYHAAAAADGTRIVPCCGFDSAPSDLGTLLVASWIRDEWRQPTRRVSASFVLRGGGLNGGTLASALAMAEDPRAAAADDVLLLNPPDRRSDAERARSQDVRGVRFDPDRNVWLSPFVMAPINTRVVRRSNALLADYGEPFGPEFAYEETMEHASRAAALATAAGMQIGDRLIGLRPFQSLVRRLGPSPGEGPSEEAMRRGSFRVRLVGEAEDGRRALGMVEAVGDPGNRVTVTILSEAALALATQRSELPGAPSRGGILTPATGIGTVLIERLRRVGFRFEVRPLP